MIFRHFRLDVNESNSYLLACSETRDALLVDAGEMSPLLLDFLDEHGLTLKAIFITHDHFDHSAGLNAAFEHFDAEVFCGKGLGIGVPATVAKHGETMSLGALTGTFLATPGHTPDSVSLMFPGLVFTGDALFAGSVGGTASPKAAKQQIDAIRKHILSLPEDYEVHPGHGPSSTVGIEKRFSPFFA